MAGSRIVALFAALALTVPAYAADPPVLPDPGITPGAVLPSCKLSDICPHERSGLRGPVSTSMRNAILRAYRSAAYCHASGACELDHSISVELCGATVAQNLWPQSYLYDEGAHMKDRLENELHRRVCAGEMTLQDAQTAISRDWLKAYVDYVGATDGR